MNKKSVFWVFLLSIVALTGFTAFEITARFFDDMDNYVVTKEFDPFLGWRLKTGNHFVRPSGRLTSIPLNINSYGLRGGEFPAVAPSLEKRIMILGDSFVFSRHFSEQDAFAGRLEKTLNAGTKRAVRVINAGVPGYGTGQELLFMKKLAQENKIIPDEYILMIFPNDILDNLSLSYGNYDSVSVKPRFELDGRGNAVLKHLPVNELDGLNETFRHSSENNPWRLRSVEFVQQVIVGFFEAHPGAMKRLLHLGVKINLPRKPGLLNGWYDDSVVGEGLPLMKALIAEMKKEAEKNGASLKVVMIPSPVQIYPNFYKNLLTRQFPDAADVKNWIADPLKAQRLLGETCKELGLEFLDLFPVLRAQHHKKLYLPRDGHFDHAGHEITAETLAKWLAGAPELDPEKIFSEPENIQDFTSLVHKQGVAK